jgi:hypothetical protein
VHGSEESEVKIKEMKKKGRRNNEDRGHGCISYIPQMVLHSYFLAVGQFLSSFFVLHFQKMGCLIDIGTELPVT